MTKPHYLDMPHGKKHKLVHLSNKILTASNPLLPIALKGVKKSMKMIKKKIKGKGGSKKANKKYKNKTLRFY